MSGTPTCYLKEPTIAGAVTDHYDRCGKMSQYVLGHHLKGEGKRLALMSELLDPMHRRHIEALEIVKPGARTLEVGCGNGSISAWLARRVSPDGKAVAVDLDLSLIDVRAPNLELRQDDIVAAPVDRRSFDLVTARAVLHHVANVEAAIGNLVASLRPDGAILLIEPDFLPVSVAKPPCTAARGTADQIYLGKKWQRVRESNPCTSLERAVS